jgi:hypothetical protein
VIVETGKRSRTEFIGNVCVKLCGTVMVTEIRKGENMKIDVRTEECLYIEINGWIYYIDDSTGERIMKKWRKKC